MNEFPSPVDIVVDDHRFATTGAWNDRPIIVRGRLNLRHLTGHPNYPKRLTVAWDYGDDNVSGMPQSDVSDAMLDFENQLLECLELENVCICVAVVTHAGSRE
jgi:hypothetical protein